MFARCGLRACSAIAALVISVATYTGPAVAGPLVVDVVRNRYNTFGPPDGDAALDVRPSNAHDGDPYTAYTISRTASSSEGNVYNPANVEPYCVVGLVRPARLVTAGLHWSASADITTHDNHDWNFDAHIAVNSAGRPDTIPLTRPPTYNPSHYGRDPDHDSGRSIGPTWSFLVSDTPLTATGARYGISASGYDNYANGSGGTASVTASLFEVRMYAWWIPGDTNGDGLVNLIDFAAVQTSFGLFPDRISPADPLKLIAQQADMDQSGRVDLVDFGYVKAHFGESLPPISPVPEPPALVLAACGAAICLIRMRLRRPPIRSCGGAPASINR